MTKTPIYIQAWMKQLSLEELQVLDAIFTKEKLFNVFKRFSRSEVERRKNIIFLLPESDPKMPIDKALNRGAVEGIESLLLMIQSSSAELDRREKKSDEGGE